MMSYSEKADQSCDNRREFSRVPAFVPFAYRIVPPADVEFLKTRTLNDSFLTDFSGVPNIEDKMYGEWFKIINAKLDELIRMTTMQRDGFSALPFQKINISGNGMSFYSPEAVPQGTVIEGKMVITTYRPIALFLYGVVVQTESLEEGYRIGISFINIDDILRNEIIRFVFEREREMIREKRRD